MQKVPQKEGFHGKRLGVFKQPTMKRTTTREKLLQDLEIKELMAG